MKTLKDFFKCFFNVILKFGIWYIWVAMSACIFFPTPVKFFFLKMYLNICEETHLDFFSCEQKSSVTEDIPCVHTLSLISSISLILTEIESPPHHPVLSTSFKNSSAR